MDASKDHHPADEMLYLQWGERPDEGRTPRMEILKARSPSSETQLVFRPDSAFDDGIFEQTLELPKDEDAHHYTVRQHEDDRFGVRMPSMEHVLSRQQAVKLYVSLGDALNVNERHQDKGWVSLSTPPEKYVIVEVLYDSGKVDFSWSEGDNEAVFDDNHGAVVSWRPLEPDQRVSDQVLQQHRALMQRLGLESKK